MVLILSQKEFEPSTEDVIDWLEFYKIPYFRLNGTDFLNKIQFENGKPSIDGLDLNLISVVWNRRWLEKEYFSNLLTKANESTANLISVHINLVNEFFYLSEFFNKSLKNVGWLSHFNEIKIRKLDMLNLANNCGLNIPEYIISTKKESILNFLSSKGKIICKPISEIVNIRYSDKKYYSRYTSYTKVITTSDDIELIPKFPSLFQEYIEKDFEVRVFFIKNKLFPMAILSQRDRQTREDFRVYNNTRPNRNIPYKFPIQIEKQIRRFIIISKLTTGSIDIIKSKAGNYYFLEVNPVGQFGMTSFPTNYQLECEIAKYLKNESDKINTRN